MYPALSQPIKPTSYYWCTTLIFITLVIIYGALHTRYSQHSVLEDYVNEQFDNYYMWKNTAWIVIQVSILSLAFLFFFHFYSNTHVHKNDYFDVTKLLIFTVVLSVASGMLYVSRKQNKLLLHAFVATLNIALLNIFWIFWQLYTY